MDILIPDSGSTRSVADTKPGEAKLWGLFGAVAVLGMLFLVGAFDRSDRQQLASSEPVAVQHLPATPATEPSLP
jgi:hypothetical protein